MDREDEQQPEQRSADDVRHGVVAGDDERDRHEHHPRRSRVAQPRERVGEERREHDASRAVPARIGVVERDDVNRTDAVRPADVRPREPDLAGELGRIRPEPGTEPQDGGHLPAAPCEQAARRGDQHRRGEERGGIEVRVEQLVPPDRVEREGSPEPGAGDDPRV